MLFQGAWAGKFSRTIRLLCAKHKVSYVRQTWDRDSTRGEVYKIIATFELRYIPSRDYISDAIIGIYPAYIAAIIGTQWMKHDFNLKDVYITWHPPENFLIPGTWHTAGFYTSKLSRLSPGNVCADIAPHQTKYREVAGRSPDFNLHPYHRPECSFDGDIVSLWG